MRIRVFRGSAQIIIILQRGGHPNLLQYYTNLYYILTGWLLKWLLHVSQKLLSTHQEYLRFFCFLTSPFCLLACARMCIVYVIKKSGHVGCWIGLLRARGEPCHLYLCTCSIPAVVNILDLGRLDTQPIEEVAIFKELLRTSVGVGGTLWNLAFELIVLWPHFKRSSVSEGFN